MTESDTRLQAVLALKRQRPRNLFLRVSLIITLIVIALCWIVGPRDPDRSDGLVRSDEGFRVSEVLSPSNLSGMANDVHKFITKQARPDPIRNEAWSWPKVGQWMRQKWNDEGAEATGRTLAVSVAAIVLAGLLGLLLTLPAARNIAQPQPFLPNAQPPTKRHRWLWSGVVAVTRAVQIFLRAMPEYILAFLLITLLGPTALPAVLALALHNAGILGKLGAEVVENADPTVPRAMRGLGANRRQIAFIGLFPQLMPRFLLFFFYRWETCVREATVLGMIGFATLGASIAESRARNAMDDLLYFTLLGAVLILAGDMLSALARWYVRRAT